jgi:COP9 signalosome complex subunit 4
MCTVANENVSLVISRQILSEFCSHFLSLPDVVGKDVAHYTLEKVQPRVVSFEEQVGK